MKLLIDVEAPGLEHFHIQEPDVPKEVGAFVRALVKSRTRCPEPRVTVVPLGDNDVCVDAAALLRLQTKAGAK